MMEIPHKLEFSADVHDFLFKMMQDTQRGEELGFEEIKEILATPPKYTTLRVNTHQTTREAVKKQLQLCLQNLDVLEHQDLPDLLVIPHKGPRTVEKKEARVVVGLQCGEAVLRGANVFAQGIVGAPAGMCKGDSVSVFADVEGKCRKGSMKPLDGRVVHVGNGIAEMSRQTLFCSKEPPSGVAVRMSDPLYIAPCLNGVLPDLMFPQNLPSVVCSKVLDPQPGERVLDMCAAPGGKTTHLAVLMQDTGRIVACDKSAKKISRIVNNAAAWKLKCIDAYAYDSTKLCAPDADEAPGPPYPPESFDRVLLDAPCSALGQRPALRSTSRLKEVASFPPLQKKLFAQAVQLLKDEGFLVYSTCTFTLEENEGLVSWALKSYPCLELCKQNPHIGGPGRPGAQLTEEQLCSVQRFFPCRLKDLSSVDRDTIGFFIAKFVKKK